MRIFLTVLICFIALCGIRVSAERLRLFLQHLLPERALGSRVLTR